MDLSVKNVYKILSILDGDKTNLNKSKDLYELLDIPYEIDINLVLNYIFETRWKNKNTSGKKVFCYLQDYDLIWFEFKRQLNIDLNIDNIDWWDFSSGLEGILLGKNSLTNRLKIRTDKIPIRNKENGKYCDNLMDMKDKYKLKNHESKENLNEKLSIFFKGLEKIAKKKAGD